MMEMKEQTGSRKKYLAPVVVLMLCLVTLTGAAYAYTSSVGIVGNTIEANEFAVEVYDNAATPALISKPFEFETVEFYSVTTIDGTNNKVEVNVDDSTLTEIKGSVVIKTNDAVDGDKKFTATITNPIVGTIAAAAVGGSSGTITYTITPGLYTDAACTEAFVSNTSDVEFDAGVGTIYYKIVVVVSGSITFNNNTPFVDCDAVHDAFVDASNFDLTFSVDGPIA